MEKTTIEIIEHLQMYEGNFKVTSKLVGIFVENTVAQYKEIYSGLRYGLYFTW